VFKIPDPDGFLSASDVKDVAEEIITALPLPGVEGSPLDPGDIWLVVIMACANQNSIWETCNDTNGTPCDDTVLAWLHTLNRQHLEFVANLLLGRLAMTILDPDRSRIVSIDFIDNPYHGEHYDNEGELCSMAPKDGTTTCHRYCTAYVVSNGKPVTLAMTYVRNDEDEADAVERVLARVENYPFDIELLLADSGFYNERVIRQARGITTTRDPVVRFAIMLVAALLENLWLVLRWAVVARPQRGGRDLPDEFTFKTFCDWIRHELEEELRRQWKIKANGVGIPASQATAAG